MKRYNLGEYKAALQEFRAAYLSKPDPAFLFNIAQCQRQLGDYGNASSTYRAFLRESSGDPAQREQVRRLVGEMEKAQADQRAHQPPTEMQAPRDETVLPPVANIPAVRLFRVPPRPWYAQPMGIVGLVTLPVGVVLLASGGGLLGASTSDRNAANRATTLDERQQLSQSADTKLSTGYALVGIGAAAAITGAILTGVAATRRYPIQASVAPSVNGISFVVGGIL